MKILLSVNEMKMVEKVVKAVESMTSVFDFMEVTKTSEEIPNIKLKDKWGSLKFNNKDGLELTIDEKFSEYISRIVDRYFMIITPVITMSMGLFKSLAMFTDSIVNELRNDWATKSKIQLDVITRCTLESMPKFVKDACITDSNILEFYRVVAKNKMVFFMTVSATLDRSKFYVQVINYSGSVYQHELKDNFLSLPIRKESFNVNGIYDPEIENEKVEFLMGDSVQKSAIVDFIKEPSSDVQKAPEMYDLGTQSSIKPKRKK